MSAFHAALGGMVTATGVGMVMVGRNWPGPSGRRRKPRATVLDDALLDELLGDWPEPVHGAPLAQAWRWCPSCCRDEPSVLHTDGSWTCGHCLETTTHATTGEAA